MSAERAAPLPLLLTHYGNVDYLARTLRCATITNPRARRILVGDEANRRVAEDCGWEHVDMGGLRSERHAAFLRRYRPVHGPGHPPMKNGKDWLRYVFERWFMVEALCRARGIERFWHFDSDVLLVEPLQPVEPALLARLDFTRQCNDTCLNGLVSLPVLSAFCDYTVGLFEDAALLQAQQLEFDTVHPNWAFTEMRAFAMFCRSAACTWRGAHLEDAVDGLWFDDCICQDDGFRTTPLCLGGPLVKDVRFSRGAFLGHRGGRDVRFAALNLSWVPTGPFDWVVSCLGEREAAGERTRDSSIRDSPLSMRYRAGRLVEHLRARFRSRTGA